MLVLMLMRRNSGWVGRQLARVVVRCRGGQTLEAAVGRARLVMDVLDRVDVMRNRRHRERRGRDNSIRMDATV